MSSPDSDDPLGIGRKLGFHRNGPHNHHHQNNSHVFFQQQQQHQSRCPPPHIVVSDTSAINGTTRSTTLGKPHHSGNQHHHHQPQQQQHGHAPNHHQHNHHNGSSSTAITSTPDLLLAKVKMKAAVDPLAHKHVEENIETFLESFKHKTWSVDALAGPAPGREGGGVMTLLDTRRTSYSDSGDYDDGDVDDNSSTTTNTTDSHCWTSSVISTDSPGDGPVGMVGGAVASSSLTASGGGAAATGGGASAGEGVATSHKQPSSLEYSPRGVTWRESDSIIAESRRIARWAWRQSNFMGSQDTPCSCSYHPPRKSILYSASPLSF
ncbi:hypothetical protein EGW08_022549 [Elysia chlorotica]|uniref:Uncharacterized protein n=1 Tax=Elysia chlorotica TaxID=188477 RepID=A0A3S0Z335_ELYCH|nr:hypothetical protein EGW08_022549 [Elysia chlorotica]